MAKRKKIWKWNILNIEETAKEKKTNLSEARRLKNRSTEKKNWERQSN